MRELERIDRIMDTLKAKWKKHPNMRYYQFMINIGLVKDEYSLWSMEDDEVEKHLKKVKL